MCGSKSVPDTPVYQPVKQVATPTLADASVTKSSSNQRKKIAGLGNRNIRTGSRGIEEEAKTDKKKLLGE